jgi:hypothetical protein
MSAVMKYIQQSVNCHFLAIGPFHNFVIPSGVNVYGRNFGASEVSQGRPTFM